MTTCVFCPNPRTTTRGEHVWDDWLNRRDGKIIRIPSRVGELGEDGALIREYGASKINVTKDVVCDSCNHGWMSDVTSESKKLLEGFILYERAATLLELGIVTLATFAFMKAAVLDYSAEETRPPFILPATCHRFRASLQQRDGVVFLPDGLQIWMIHYRSVREKLEFVYWVESMALTYGPFRGYEILLVTYVAGSFAFQLSFPRWRKNKRHPGIPLFNQPSFWDKASTLVWPGVNTAKWPPPQYVSSASFEDFRKRLTNIHIPRT